MCGFKKQKKALTFYSQSLICHCNALVLLSFIILPYQTSAFPAAFLLWLFPAVLNAAYEQRRTADSEHAPAKEERCTDNPFPGCVLLLLAMNVKLCVSAFPALHSKHHALFGGKRADIKLGTRERGAVPGEKHHALPVLYTQKLYFTMAFFCREI